MMDEFRSVSLMSGSAVFDQVLNSPVLGSQGPVEFTERSGNYLTSIINDELPQNMIHEEQRYNPNPDPVMSPVSFVNQDQNAGMMFPITSLDSMSSVMSYGSDTTNCDRCGLLVSNNQDAIMSHSQQCCPEEQLSTSNTRKIDKTFVGPKPAAPASNKYNGDQQLADFNWEKYMRTLQVKMAPDYNFSTKSYTCEVPGLDPGMKLEAIDKNNPQSFCVATVVEVIGHRVRIRYDGYGRDDSNDFWCNFQAEELYPIGWCAQNAFPLQPPVGITCTLEEWRKFLTQTLTGALAAPKHLFPSEHFQPRVHAFEIGMKVEVIHPKKPYMFCAGTVVKSLGPYYFLVATDKLIDNTPITTMCCHSDSSNIFPAGWSHKNGIEFTVPSGYTRKSFSWDKYTATTRSVCAPHHFFKKTKTHKFRMGQKLEAVDLEQPRVIRVATVMNVMGRVLQLYFDGLTRYQYVECDSPDIHGFGWCKRTAHPLTTPNGRVPFKTVTKFEGSESFPNKLKLISFADVIGRKPTQPHIANPTENENVQSPTTSKSPTPSPAASYNHSTPHIASLSPTPPNLVSPTGHITPSDSITPSDPPPYNPTAPRSLSTSSSAMQGLPAATPSMLASSPSVANDSYPTTAGPGHSSQESSMMGPEQSIVVEPGENIEDKEKCPTLSPSDDDEDLSDEDGSGTGSERFYHNKNQIYFNKTCCCGPLLNPEEVRLLPDATEPGKVTTVLRIGLEMVVKCAKEPERVLEMMQEGSGVRLMIKHNGKTFKKAISRVDSRPKLERYLKRFCRRLVCCEYFLNLTPVASPCPDDCKADQYGNLQGPKGMKAKRAREYFETKHLGHEKKKRGRRPRAVANEAAAQRAAAGIVTSVFHKGNHVPLPNLNLPVTAIADHLRNTATKILHQVQASQAMLHSKAASSSTCVTQAPVAHAASQQHPHTPTALPNTPSQTSHHPTASTTAAHLTQPVSSVPVPTYGKPRLLPSPYGSPPIPITSSSESGGNGRGGSYRAARTPNQPPKRILPNLPAAVPDRSIPVPVSVVEIHIPAGSKRPLPARAAAKPATGNSVTSDSTTLPAPVPAKQVFRLEPPKFISPSGNKVPCSFSGKLVAVPASGSYAPFTRNNSRQTTTLVTANQHPIPASISLTNAGPPPLIPARAISGIPNPKGVQILRPRLMEGKVIAAAPNVCVTERGTIVAAQLNKASVPSSGACGFNHVGQSPDANVMMHKMFSVVGGGENLVPVPITLEKVPITLEKVPITLAKVPITIANVPANVSRAQQGPQIAHVYPSLKKENSLQNTNNSHQNTNKSHHNTSNSHQSTNKTNQTTGKPSQHANNPIQNTNVPHQNTHTSYQSTHIPRQSTQRFDGSMNRANSNTGKYDRHVNRGSESTVKKFSIGGGMGAVTSAVRSGILGPAKYKPRDESRDTKHVITKEGGYSVKISDHNLQAKPDDRSAISSRQADITPNGSDKRPNITVVTTNIAEVTPTISEVSPTPSEEIPMLSDVRTKENDGGYKEAKNDLDNVSTNKRGNTWRYRRRKKKKNARFTYVKGKKNKKKEVNYGENLAFEQEFYNEDQISEHLNGPGRGIKRDHDGDVDDKNDPPYAPPRGNEVCPKRAKKSSDLHPDRIGATPAQMTSYVTSQKAELMKGVLHAVQSSQHPSVKLRSPNEKQSHSFNGFSSPPKRARFNSADGQQPRKGRPSLCAKSASKSSTSREKVSVNASTNTSLPGCPSDKCLYHSDNPRLWTVDQVREYISATDCKNYATYLMDQEIDGESLLLLTRSTLMQFTNMKLGPTLKLSNYIAQLRARVGMSKQT